MSENKEHSSSTDDVIENDVTADPSHGCQIQLVVSYNRLQQTIVVNIVRILGMNYLNGRNKRSETITTATDTHGRRHRTAYEVTHAAAAAMTTDSLTTNGNAEGASSAHSVYVGLTVLPDRDKCVVTTAKKRGDVVVWNEAFSFGGEEYTTA